MTTHTNLIARLREFGPCIAQDVQDALEALEQQVAALIEERNQEHSMACEIHAANLEIRYELAAAQAQLEEARAEIERLKREN